MEEFPDPDRFIKIDAAWKEVGCIDLYEDWKIMADEFCGPATDLPDDSGAILGRTALSILTPISPG